MNKCDHLYKLHKQHLQKYHLCRDGQTYRILYTTIQDNDCNILVAN